MSFNVVCKCGAILKIKDELAGKQRKCPSCRIMLDLTPPAGGIETTANSIESVTSPDTNDGSFQRAKSESNRDQEATRTIPPPIPSRLAFVTPAKLPRPAPPPILQKSNRKSKTLLITCIILSVIVAVSTAIIALLTGTRPSVNPGQSIANSRLQSLMNQVIQADVRNSGIDVKTFYRDAFSKSVIVLDIQNITGSVSRIDVFRVLLSFAEEIKDEQFTSIELSFRGETRFIIQGSYFRTLGHEREIQNPVYTIRTFPEKLKTPEGNNAYPEWSGGMLGVLNKQMEDFNDFHDKWYLEDVGYTL